MYCSRSSRSTFCSRSSGSKARTGSSGIHGVRRSLSQCPSWNTHPELPQLLNIPRSLPHKGQAIIPTLYSRVSSHLLPLWNLSQRSHLCFWTNIPASPLLPGQQPRSLREGDKVCPSTSPILHKGFASCPGNLIFQEDSFGILEFFEAGDSPYHQAERTTLGCSTLLIFLWFPTAHFTQISYFFLFFSDGF